MINFKIVWHRTTKKSQSESKNDFKCTLNDKTKKDIVLKDKSRVLKIAVSQLRTFLEIGKSLRGEVLSN